MALSSFYTVKGVPAASQYVNHYTLAANTAETITVPAGAEIVSLGCSQDYWVRWNGGAATIPAGDVTNGDGSEYCPTSRSIRGVGSFSVICASAALLSVAYYGKVVA